MFSIFIVVTQEREGFNILDEREREMVVKSIQVHGRFLKKIFLGFLPFLLR